MKEGYSRWPLLVVQSGVGVGALACRVLDSLAVLGGHVVGVDLIVDRRRSLNLHVRFGSGRYERNRRVGGLQFGRPLL